MDWSCIIILECRIYGRQTSDANVFLADVKEKLHVVNPTFSVSKTTLKYLAVSEHDVEEAQDRGFLITYDRVSGTPNVILHTGAFTKQCTSLSEAMSICETIELSLKEVFTSIQIRQSAWLDRVPH